MQWSGLGDARLRALAAEKLTATQIGQILGVSRNAVIGRCHRAGIQLQSVSHPSYQRKPPPVRTGPRKRVLTPGKPEPNPPRRAYRSVRFPPLEAPPNLTVAAIDAAHVVGRPLLDLPKHGCRYAVSTDDAESHLFCGERKHGKQSYCECHCRIAYEPAKKRERR